MNYPVVLSSITISTQSALGVKREISSQGVLKLQFWVGKNVASEVGAIVGKKVEANARERGRREVGGGDGTRVGSNVGNLVGKRVGGLEGAFDRDVVGANVGT